MYYSCVVFLILIFYRVFDICLPGDMGLTSPVIDFSLVYCQLIE